MKILKKLAFVAFSGVIFSLATLTSASAEVKPLNEKQQIISRLMEEGKNEHQIQEITGYKLEYIKEQYYYKLKPNVNRSKFTAEEDELLLRLYNENGSKWSEFTKHFNGRTCRQLRHRYTILFGSPNSSNTFTPEEDKLILSKVATVGQKWSYIAKCFNPKRRAREIKNRYNRLILMGRKNEVNAIDFEVPTKSSATGKVKLPTFQIVHFDDLLSK